LAIEVLYTLPAGRCPELTATYCMTEINLPIFNSVHGKQGAFLGRGLRRLLILLTVDNFFRFVVTS
jgi:hypothetical protein